MVMSLSGVDGWGESERMVRGVGDQMGRGFGFFYTLAAEEDRVDSHPVSGGQLKQEPWM